MEKKYIVIISIITSIGGLAIAFVGTATNMIQIDAEKTDSEYDRLLKQIQNARLVLDECRPIPEKKQFYEEKLESAAISLGVRYDIGNATKEFLEGTQFLDLCEDYASDLTLKIMEINKFVSYLMYSTLSVNSSGCNFENTDYLMLQANIDAENKDYQEAQRIYEEILECNSNDVNAVAGLAYVYTERSKIDEAEKLYFEVLQIESNNLEAKTGYGYLLSQTNRLDEAEEICNSVIMEDQKNYLAHNCLGEVYKNKEDYEKAERSYANSIKIKNEQNKAYNGLGFIHLVSGEIDKSLKNYHRSLENYKDDPDALFGLGVGYLIKGDNIASQKYFDILIKSELFSTDELIEVADIMIEEENIEFAHKIYNTVEEFEFNDEQRNKVTNGQANYHLQRGNLSEAEKLYLETLSRDHENFNALMGMCHVKQENGEYSSAGDYRKLAAAVDPDNPRLEVECLVSTE